MRRSPTLAMCRPRETAGAKRRVSRARCGEPLWSVCERAQKERRGGREAGDTRRRRGEKLRRYNPARRRGARQRRVVRGGHARSSLPTSEKKNPKRAAKDTTEERRALPFRVSGACGAKFVSGMCLDSPSTQLPSTEPFLGRQQVVEVFFFRSTVCRRVASLSLSPDTGSRPPALSGTVFLPRVQRCEQKRP